MDVNKEFLDYEGLEYYNEQLKEYIKNLGGGDMNKSAFATIKPNDGYVDKAVNADQLGGVEALSYATKDDISGFVSESGLGSLAKKNTVTKADLTSGIQTSLGKADTALQEGDISVVSTIGNGLAPMVTNASGYLKGDGTWDVPTNTSYSFNEGTINGAFSVTPSGGTTQSVKVHGVVTDISGKLDKSGGAMTGNISYQGTNATYEMIKFIDNTSDTYGNGIAIGGGGLTIVGGGESTNVIAAKHSTGGDENLILSNDGAVDVFANCQNGYDSAKHSIFNTDGTFTPATSGSVASGNTKAVTGGVVYTALMAKAGLDYTTTEPTAVTGMTWIGTAK